VASLGTRTTLMAEVPTKKSLMTTPTIALARLY